MLIIIIIIISISILVSDQIIIAYLEEKRPADDVSREDDTQADAGTEQFDNQLTASPPDIQWHCTH